MVIRYGFEYGALRNIMHSSKAILCDCSVEERTVILIKVLKHAWSFTNLQFHDHVRLSTTGFCR